MRTRVIGLGQAAAGDDGVGLAVVRHLRARGLESRVELVEVADASALVSLLGSEVPAIIVDALLGSPAGEVVEPSAEELAAGAPLRISSHGFSVLDAIELARVLDGGRRSPMPRIVAVTIARPERYHEGLSPEVAAAVARAADRVIELLAG